MWLRAAIIRYASRSANSRQLAKRRTRLINRSSKRSRSLSQRDVELIAARHETDAVSLRRIETARPRLNARLWFRSSGRGRPVPMRYLVGIAERTTVVDPY